MYKKATSVGIVTAPGNMPGLYLDKLLRIVEAQGFSTSHFRRTCQVLQVLPHGVAFDELELSYEDYGEFVEALLSEFDIPGLGLLMGQQFRTTDFGILGYAILSCRCLRAAIPILNRYQSLWGGSPNLRCHYEIGDKISSHKEHCNLPPSPLRRFELEESTAQFLSIKGLLDNPADFKLKKVTFAFERPHYFSLYEDMFACPVQFDQPHTELFYGTSMLDAPFSAANDLAQDLCEQQCEKFLRQLEGEGGLTEKVRAAIINSPGQIPALGDLAEQFNLSVRTLRRRLKAENTSYQQILNDVRFQLAKQYLLETTLSIKEIGYLLGYTEVANFQRAFKSWYDITPNDMRLQGE